MSKDYTTVLGILFAFVLVIGAIILGGKVRVFIDLPSMLIVVGGTFVLTAACFSVNDVVTSIQTTVKNMFYRPVSPTNTAVIALKVAELARKEGVLSLEKHVSRMHSNPFLLKASRVIADGMIPEKIERLLSEDIQTLQERYIRSAAVLRKAAEIAPSMGLIGTLIGLVQMLGGLNDPSTIGPAMAVALLTTFYGALLAFMVFTPLASRLERNAQGELLSLMMYLKTADSIVRQENPRQLETLLNSMLPQSQQIAYFKS